MRLIICLLLLANPGGIYREVPPPAGSAGRLLIRQVEKPTRANLDWAAWRANPLLAGAPEHQPQPPTPRPTLADLTFGGELLAGSQVERFEQLPLTPAQRARPLAWAPLIKALQAWDYDRSEALASVGYTVAEELWADDKVTAPYQQLVAAWLGGEPAAPECYVEVELAGWTTFIDGVSDPDGDGRREFYARVRPTALTPELAAWIRDDYAGRSLAGAELDQWATDLARLWYPGFQTYRVTPDKPADWPGDPLEPVVRRLVAEQPAGRRALLIHGQPAGQIIWNVFLIGP